MNLYFSHEVSVFSNCFHPISHISHPITFPDVDVSRCLSSRGVPGLPITARPGDDRKEARIAIDIACQISSVSITSESRIVSVYSFRIVSVNVSHIQLYFKHVQI